jgi:hypothetical protein
MLQGHGLEANRAQHDPQLTKSREDPLYTHPHEQINRQKRAGLFPARPAKPARFASFSVHAM